MQRISYTSSILLIVFLFSGCNSFKKGWSDMNLFPLSYDVDLGKQLAGDIQSKPDEFPILDPIKNKKVYAYIDQIVQKILHSGNIKNVKNFEWNVKIIRDDKTLNAFAAPGGYIYLYTGLILFLDSENELAGVLGHEMAHADQRHSTKQLTKNLGVQLLLNVVLNSASKNQKANETIGNITSALVGLKFSRTHESEADNYSVQYLCPTAYKADGAAGFFKKMYDQPTPPQWLSTHPNSKNRVEMITKASEQLGCKGTQRYQKPYEEIKDLIRRSAGNPSGKSVLTKKKNGTKKQPGKVIMPKRN